MPRLNMPCKPNSRDKKARAQRPKSAKQTETGSRFTRCGPCSASRSCHDTSRQIRVGGQCSLRWFPDIPSETEFTKIVSEEIATARARHTSRRRRIPVPPTHAVVRAVTATKHELGLCRPCIVLSHTAQKWRFGLA